MGKLTEIKAALIPTRNVKVGEGGKAELTVRGLSLADISQLLRSYGAELDTIYESYIESAVSDDFTLAAFLQQLLISMPDLLCHVIAFANDDSSPEAVAAAKALTLLDQVAILLAIAELTFRSEADVKNLAERVGMMFSKTASTLTAMQESRQVLKNGAGTSGS